MQAGSIILDSVTKSFKRQTNKKRSYQTFKSSLLNFISPAQTKAEANLTRALDNVSLEIKPGVALGVIGRNGSGKSTLLKLISGIYKPDQGVVQKAGRVSALIELGAGFHPDFTGRENVYLAGIMYGLSKKEIRKRFDAIVEFAELAHVIDDPVRTYSSGMFMRLGFSVAIHTDPDILLIDEVLAVGDAAFVSKCRDVIQQFKHDGKTLLFVTHDLDPVVRWCDKAVWLSEGTIKLSGEPRYVVDSYLEAVEEGRSSFEHQSSEEQLNQAEDLLPDEDGESPDLAEKESTSPNRWGTSAVEIDKVRLLSENGEETSSVKRGENITVQFEFIRHKEVSDYVFGIGLLRQDGTVVSGTNTHLEGIDEIFPHGQCPKSGKVTCELKNILLTPGKYFIDVAAHAADGTPYDYHHEKYSFQVKDKIAYHGIYLPEHCWSFEAGLQETQKQKVNE